MKKSGLSLPFLLLLLLLLFQSCTEKYPDIAWQDAIITGFDNRECACCGGLMITLTENPVPYEAPFYQWDKAEDEYKFVDDEGFPIAVQVKFDSLPDHCGNWIEVLDLELIK